VGAAEHLAGAEIDKEAAGVIAALLKSASDEAEDRTVREAAVHALGARAVHTVLRALARAGEEHGTWVGARRIALAGHGTHAHAGRAAQGTVDRP
jgi:hypothetical protein